ncbi:MAG: DNA polymerase IV [Candidatus Omnitrophica bacterium]|nr:DNA polymerase IV [Candidatus Omnitrophota bacterium]
MIIHVDCDAFFASVEQSLKPALKGKPVIVGKDRGIAAAFSYEAKRAGVIRAMPLSEIKKLCPDAVFLPCDYESYSLFSQRFYAILRRFTPDVEEYSIDEAFAELSGLRRVYRASYEAIAFDIKKTIEKELGITVSVGLSLTKSLAKICSKDGKPSGFTAVRGHELRDYLKTVKIQRVCGFGPSSTALLAKHAVHTVWDYVQRPEIFARKLLGKIGSELWHELRGESVYPILTEKKEAQASLSKTKTFTPASNNRDFVRAQLIRNMESAFIKLRRHHMRTKGIGIYLKNNDHQGQGLFAELARHTDSPLEGVDIVSRLFDRLFNPATRYRATGVWFHDLEYGPEVQRDLFDDPAKITALREISKVIDEAGALYGKHALHLASSDVLREYRQHLGDRGDFSQRKVQPLKGENFRQHLKIPLWDVKV